jgi:hypothetical protein
MRSLAAAQTKATSTKLMREALRCMMASGQSAAEGRGGDRGWKSVV